MKRVYWTLALMMILALFLGTGTSIASPPTTEEDPTPLLRAQAATTAKGDWERVWRSEGALYDLLGIDDNTVIGVGSDGMIVSSTDGGTYWHYQAPADGKDLFAITASSSSLWAVGEEGIVLRSLDNGATWERIDAGTTSTLRDVAVVGGAHVWVAGEGGIIRATADGGATWSAQDSGVTADLTSIAFFDDARHGIAAGKHGVALVTEDGGDTWTPVNVTSAAINDLFLAENKAWLAGEDGNVYFSDDQGATWRTLASLWFPITRIRMHPGQTQKGWLVGLNGKMASTSDSGATWDANRGDEGYHLYALGIGEANSIWVGGSVMVEDHGNWGNMGVRPAWFVWGSADGGASWRAIITGLYPRLYNITAASEMVAYAVGQNLQVLKTEDAGYSWREIHQEMLAAPGMPPLNPLADKMLHGVSCAPDNPNDCRVAGREELMLHTTDGGDTWTKEGIPGVGRSIYDVVMTSAESGLAISRDYNYFMEDGVTWEGAFDNGTGRTHLDLDMINSWQGVASTKKNLVDYTLDAGRHWKGYFFYQFGIFYNSGADALDIDGDGNLDYAWLAGCTAQGSIEGPCIEGAILFSPDVLSGPDSWRALLLDPDVPRLQKIEMADEQTGWAVGYDATVLFTEDSGATWQRQPAPSDAHLYGMDVYNRGLVYAVGLRGDILRYSEPDRRLYAHPQWRNRVDGDLSEWNALNARHLNSDDMDSIQGEAPDPANLDASVRVRWDDQGLYLGIEVIDATLVDSGPLVDQIGVALDGANDGVIGDDDHAIFFLADGSAQGMPVGGRYAVVSGEDGYAIEAFIPQSALGGGFEHLRKIGVNVALFDARPGESAYAAQMIWAGEALAADPAAFGYITLFQYDRIQPTQIALAQNAIEIDGDLADWSDEHLYGLSAATADSIQGEFPTGMTDLSGDVRFRWWEDYLFVSVRVQDDQVTRGDSMRIAFDVDGNSALSPEDVTYQIWPNGRVDANGETPAAALAAGVQETAGYTLEIAIPAQALGGPLQAASRRQTLHVNYALFDDDDDDGEAETAMNWQGASVDGVRADFGWLEIAPITLLVKADFDDPGFQDTFISEWAPTTNYDRLDTLRIRPGGVETPLIRVDVDSFLPEGVRLSLAYLGLYTVQDREDASLTARLYRLLRPWSVSEVTWQQAANGQSWEQPGAQGASDQASTLTDEQALAPMGANGACGDRNATWFTITEDVQRFVAGEEANYGWALRGDAGAQINYVLGSTRHANPDCRPELYFEYTFPAGSLPTPTPTVISLYLPLIIP